MQKVFVSQSSAEVKTRKEWLEEAKSIMRMRARYDY
jgi:hypothetical protein